MEITARSIPLKYNEMKESQFVTSITARIVESLTVAQYLIHS